MISSTENKSLNFIEGVQKLLFFISLTVIPLSVFPLPWDLTEYSMSIVMLFFATLVVSLEIAKLFWTGRTIIKRTIVDTGVLLLAVSIITSTVFSVSTQSSLWGFDYRLGSGTVIFISSLLYLYSARVFLKGTDDVFSAVKFLVAGVSLGALFSILSFWGVNILNTVPGFDTHFTTGLPLYSSSRVSLVIWGVSSILSAGILFDTLKKGKTTQPILPIVTFALNLLAIILFSLVQGWAQVVLLIISFILLLALPLIRKRPLNKTYLLSTVVLTLTLTAIFLLFRIPQLKEVLVRDSSSLITQLTIDPQVSWRVATTSMSESVLRGFVGLGQDTFSIAYNLYRPLSTETILLNTTNFTNANIHLINVLATRGVLGILVWLALGLVIIKSLFDSLKKNSFEKPVDFFIVTLDIAVLYIYASSAFIYFTFLIIFTLLLLVSLSTILKSERNVESLESFILNVGLFLRKQGESVTRPVATTTVLVVLILTISVLFYLGRYVVSSGYVLQAEAISAKGRELAQEEKLSESERAQILIDSSNLYGKAIRLSPNNDVLHRRGALIVLQYVEYLATKYNETEIEEEKKVLFEQIAAYIEIAVEESKRATELNSQTYANWGSRSSIYSKLVGLGLTSYTRSALSSMQTAAQYNPLNYELYYNAAQLYVVNNDNDMALRTLSQVFSINPDHIPSLILGGELSLNDGDSRQALRYFEDAKRVMDGLSSTDSDVYDYVVSKISKLDQGGSVRQQDAQNEEKSEPILEEE